MQIPSNQPVSPTSPSQPSQGPQPSNNGDTLLTKLLSFLKDALQALQSDLSKLMDDEKNKEPADKNKKAGPTPHHGQLASNDNQLENPSLY